ncbi:MAG: AgmX/PglI C-terminal domain-containing protein [Myxococcota bacterium]
MQTLESGGEVRVAKGCGEWGWVLLWAAVGCSRADPVTSAPPPPPTPSIEPVSEPTPEALDELARTLSGDTSTSAKRPKRRARQPAAMNALRELYREERPSPAPSDPPRALFDEQARHSAPAPAGLEKALALHRNGIRHCIEKELRANPTLSGTRIHLVLSLSADGRVRTSRLDRPELDAAELGRCLKSRAARMRFSPLGEETDLELPLLLVGG